MLVFDIQSTGDGGGGSHIRDGGFASNKGGDGDDFATEGEGSFGAFFVKFGI